MLKVQNSIYFTSAIVVIACGSFLYYKQRTTLNVLLLCIGCFMLITGIYSQWAERRRLKKTSGPEVIR
jgi:uncharacterized membrane protein HdeD (DUF308 family)